MKASLAVVAFAIGCSDPAAEPAPAQAPRSVAPDAGAAGPHHLFPAAAAAASTTPVEEPDRGPEVPLSYALPARSSLVWTTHAYCELDENLPICGSDPPNGLTRYQVGSGTGRTVVEQVRGTEVDTIWVYETAASGTTTRRLTLDAGQRVSNLITIREATFMSAIAAGQCARGCGRMGASSDRPAGSSSSVPH